MISVQERSRYEFNGPRKEDENDKHSFILQHKCINLYHHFPYRFVCQAVADKYKFIIITEFKC